MPRRYHYTRKTGRPTKYRPAYCQRVVEFFRTRAVPGAPMVTLLDFALSLNPSVSVDAVFDWEHAHPEFRHSVKTALRFQEGQLAQRGLAGEWNPAMSIFLLKNNHGYRDRPPDDAPTVNVSVSVSMIDALKTVAQHQLPRLDPAFHDNGRLDA